MKKFLLLLLFSLVLAVGFAEKHESANGPLHQDRWEELAEDLDYEEDERKPKDRNVPKFKLFNFDSQILKYGFFAIVLGILVYILIRYLLTLQGNAAVREDLQVEVKTLREAEENPLIVNLSALITKLVAEGDYRGAVRAYFLLVLQTLHRHKRIEWKKPKTNFDYVREVATEPYFAAFSKLAYYFELVWYGQQDVEKSDFARLEPEFTQLLKALKKDAQ